MRSVTYWGPVFLGKYNSVQFSFPFQIYRVSLHLWKQSVHLTIWKNWTEGKLCICLLQPLFFQVFRGNKAILSTGTLTTSLLPQITVPKLYIRMTKKYHCELVEHVLCLCVPATWKIWSLDVHLVSSHLFTDLNTACLLWVQRSTTEGEP